MTRIHCDGVRELLPDLHLGELDAGTRQQVEGHLAGCEACREEAGLLRAVLAARPEAPPGLEARIRARLAEERSRDSVGISQAGRRESAAQRSRRGIPGFGWRMPLPATALPVAAVLVLALGTALFLRDGVEDVEQDPIQVVQADDPLPEAYLWDDGVVAGAPLFDGLSEDELETLLADLEGEA